MAKTKERSDELYRGRKKCNEVCKEVNEVLFIDKLVAEMNFS